MSEYRLVRHRGQWSLAFTDPERGRVRIATGTAERGLAEARAGEIWRARSRPRTETVAELWPPYAADRRSVVARPERFAQVWKMLAPHFGYKLGRAITKADCRAYAAARRKLGRSDSTIRTELELLRACLRWHFGKEAPEIPAPPPSKPRDRYLTRAEAEALLATIATPHVRLFVELAIGTGARMAAILDLTWDRVDLAHGTIDFRPAGRDVTNKRRTVVPITARLRPLLEEARAAALTQHVVEYSGGPVKSVKKAIASAARRSGISCSPHVFRHTAAVWAVQADVPLEQIAQWLGHTSTRVTYATYARYSPRFMQQMATALDW